MQVFDLHVVDDLIFTEVNSYLAQKTNHFFFVLMCLCVYMCLLYGPCTCAQMATFQQKTKIELSINSIENDFIVRIVENK